MLEVFQTTDRCVLTTGGLRLEFWRETDRWRHAILVRRNGHDIPLLESVEGSPRDSFPPSPAFQELILEKISDDCREAQLFGQAGKNLYAAAIRIDAQTGEIDFDVSVRMRGDDFPESMVSTYRLGEGLEAISSDMSEAVSIFGADHPRQFVLQSKSIAGSPSCGISAMPSRELRIGCLALGNSDLAGTAVALRWTYRIS